MQDRGTKILGGCLALVIVGIPWVVGVVWIVAQFMEGVSR